VNPCENPCVPSVELTELQSFICRIEPQAIGLPTASSVDLFPNRSATSRPTVPRPLRGELILSCSASPSKFLRQTSWLAPCETDLPSLGFVPLRDSTGGVHSHGRTPSPAKFRPQAFSTSRRVAQPSGLAGLLNPAATCRVRSVQGFLPTRSLPGSSPVRTPMALSPFSSPATEAAGCHLRGRHLRGVAPRVEAFVEAGV
jgi:hypothetical protein